MFDDELFEEASNVEVQHGTNLDDSNSWDNNTPRHVPSPNHPDDRLNLPAMALHVHGDWLGCAVWIPLERKLLLLHDRPFQVRQPQPFDPSLSTAASYDSDSASPPSDRQTVPCDDSSVLETLIFQFQPGLIFVSANSPECVLSALARRVSGINVDLQVRQPREFNHLMGLELIKSSLQLADSDPDDLVTSSRETLSQISSMLKLESQLIVSQSRLSLSAAAPLLTYMKGADDFPSFITVGILSTNNCLYLDQDALKALSICNVETHASLHSSQIKEGMSVLALLSLNNNKHSTWLLRQWLMFPLTSLRDIEKRHDAVEHLMGYAYDPPYSQIEARLKEVSNVPQLVFLLAKGIGTLSTWHQMRKSCAAIVQLHFHLSRLHLLPTPLLHKLLSEIVPQPIQTIEQRLNTTIDWQDSRLEGRVCIRRGVDSQLDALRDDYAGLPDLLIRIANQIRLEPAFVHTSRVDVVYFPQIGYLISVPLGEQVDLQADPTITHQFSSDMNDYLKNDKMYNMDKHYGDLASFISDREIEILDQVQRHLISCTKVLLSAASALDELDCLMAFAKAASLYNFTRPTMVDQSVLDLKGSRHPLKEIVDPSYVPNDLLLVGGHGQDRDSVPSVLIVTGANSSGKSCLLQQAALSVFLAQCGSFVPATAACLGVFDKILTRMRQDESVISQGSSFSRELGQLSRAVLSSTSRSLVILDEVGKGCRADDGAGLFCASIIEFLDRGLECPIVLAATHHLKAIELLLPSSLPIFRGHMQTIVDPLETTKRRNQKRKWSRGWESSLESLTFLYRLMPGLATTSHACYCARICGIPESIVSRAQQLIDQGLFHSDENDTISNDMNREEEIARRFVELDLENSQMDGLEQVGRIFEECRNLS